MLPKLFFSVIALVLLSSCQESRICVQLEQETKILNLEFEKDLEIRDFSHKSYLTQYDLVSKSKESPKSEIFHHIGIGTPYHVSGWSTVLYNEEFPTDLGYLINKYQDNNGIDSTYFIRYGDYSEMTYVQVSYKINRAGICKYISQTNIDSTMVSICSSASPESSYQTMVEEHESLLEGIRLRAKK